MDLLDPAELVDATEVAAILGLSSRTAVSVYRRRYEDFPPPVIEKSRCHLWVRSQIDDWIRRRGPQR